MECTTYGDACIVAGDGEVSKEFGFRDTEGINARRHEMLLLNEISEVDTIFSPESTRCARDAQGAVAKGHSRAC